MGIELRIFGRPARILTRTNKAFRKLWSFRNKIHQIFVNFDVSEKNAVSILIGPVCLLLS